MPNACDSESREERNVDLAEAFPSASAFMSKRAQS